MALEIGPTQTALGSGASSKTSKTSATQNTQALAKGTLSTTVETKSEGATRNTISPVQAEERQATAILFSASTSLSNKQSATENLLSTVEDLKARAEQIESETNPTRRQELIDEAEAVRAQAEADFAAAVEENPGLADNETITAVITPGENPESGQTTFTTSVPGASSPAQVGLSDVDLSDGAAAQESLAEIESTLRRELSSFSSARSNISAAVRDRGQAIAAESEAAGRVDADQRSEELAQEVAASASGITEASLVEQLDVQSLIIEEEVSRASEARAAERATAREPIAEDDSNNQATTIGQESNEDAATKGARLVQS